MITKEQSLTVNEFHYTEHYHNGAEQVCRKWRRNGQTRLWKRDPARFEVPVKYGLYSYGYVTNLNAPSFHTVEDCPQSQVHNKKENVNV